MTSLSERVYSNFIDHVFVKLARRVALAVVLICLGSSLLFEINLSMLSADWLQHEEASIAPPLAAHLRQDGKRPSTGRRFLKKKDRGPKSSPHVLYTVFAGRKDRLLLQEPYWREMKRMKAIDEVHLWKFTNNDKDVDYIQHLGKKYSSFLKIMEPEDVPVPETYWFDKNHSFKYAKEELGRGRVRLDWPGRRIYTEYYKYYTDNPYDGVIIKADDDIVWINTTQVTPYVEYLWNHRDIFLLSASVVNQGLCAYYQQKHGAIPKDYLRFPKPSNGMGDLQSNGTEALMLHRYFLESKENREKFFITKPAFYPFPFTINVNFIAIRGEDFPKTFQLILEMLQRENRYYDEGAIAHDGIEKGYREGIYMPLVVSHATYSHQLIAARDVLTAYHDYAKTELPDFYGKILDEWVAPPVLSKDR